MFNHEHEQDPRIIRVRIKRVHSFLDHPFQKPVTLSRFTTGTNPSKTLPKSTPESSDMISSGESKNRDEIK